MNYLTALTVFLQEEAPRANSGGWIFGLAALVILLIGGFVLSVVGLVIFMLMRRRKGGGEKI
jgi:hypothetical protein